MDTNTPNPTTLVEAIRHFSDPDACLKFLIPLRWPDGIACPRCGSREHSFISTRRVWKCKGCKKQFSVKVGTVMEDSPLGLDKWLTAIWLIANAKNGISSWEVHRALGITQKSAWFLLHRIRLAMQTGTFVNAPSTAPTESRGMSRTIEGLGRSSPRDSILGRRKRSVSWRASTYPSNARRSPPRST